MPEDSEVEQVIEATSKSVSQNAGLEPNALKTLGILASIQIILKKCAGLFFRSNTP